MCDRDISTFVDALYHRDENEFAGVAKFLWENPELSGQEWKAHDFLVSFLRHKGFEVQSAYLGFKTAFRADFEAIPGMTAFVSTPTIEYLNCIRYNYTSNDSSFVYFCSSLRLTKRLFKHFFKDSFLGKEYSLLTQIDFHFFKAKQIL